MSYVKHPGPKDHNQMGPANDPATEEAAEEKGDISPQDPGSMPRAEDDEKVLRKSPEFHDRPDGATKDHA